MNKEKEAQDLHVSQHSSNEMLSAAFSVEEGNKLIAKFMDEYDLYHWGRNPFNELLTATYNSAWNKLMPVVEKISKIEFHREMQDLGDGEIETIIYTHYPRTFGMLNNETGNPMFRYNSGCVFEAETLIEAAWLATVDMIKTLCL